LPKDTRGATAIEYALIASLIAMVIIGGAAQLGGSLQATFQMVAAAF
jgi:pilus assembly protein Flp/PilA